MFSVFVNPSVTPVTAFWIRDRVSPCMALCSGESEARSTTMLPSSCLTSIPRPTGTVRSPFGPFTFTLRPESSTLTAPGISTGAFPTLDTLLTSLVDEAQDFASDAPAPGLVVGQDPLGGREYRHPEAVEHAGDAGLLAVDAATGTAHPPQARDAAAAVGAVLQRYHEPPLHAAAALRDALDVALFLQDAGDLRLHPGVRDLDRLVLGHVGVADARQEIRYRIVNRHRLPTRFRNARDLPLVGQLPQADPAQAELPVVAARPAAPLAPAILPDRELLLSLLLCQQCFSRHPYLSALPERHPEEPQELPRLFVALRRRHYGHVEAARGVDGVVGDLREDHLLPEPYGVVSMAVKGSRANAPEIPDAREGYGDEAVEELPHALAAQRDPRAHGHALPDLEPGYGLPRPPQLGLLARDPGEVLHRAVHGAAVDHGLPDAHVDYDLLQTGRAHGVLYAEPLLEVRGDLLFIPVPHPSHRYPSLTSCRPEASPPSP